MSSERLLSTGYYITEKSSNKWAENLGKIKLSEFCIGTYTGNFNFLECSDLTIESGTFNIHSRMKLIGEDIVHEAKSDIWFKTENCEIEFESAFFPLANLTHKEVKGLKHLFSMEKGTFAKENYICSLTDIKLLNKRGMIGLWNQSQGGLFFVENTANSQTNTNYNSMNHLRGQMFPSSRYTRPPTVERFTNPPQVWRPTVRAQPPPSP